MIFICKVRYNKNIYKSDRNSLCVIFVKLRGAASLVMDYGLTSQEFEAEWKWRLSPLDNFNLFIGAPKLKGIGWILKQIQSQQNSLYCTLASLFSKIIGWNGYRDYHVGHLDGNYKDYHHHHVKLLIIDNKIIPQPIFHPGSPNISDCVLFYMHQAAWHLPFLEFDVHYFCKTPWLSEIPKNPTCI